MLPTFGRSWPTYDCRVFIGRFGPMIASRVPGSLRNLTRNGCEAGPRPLSALHLQSLRSVDAAVPSRGHVSVSSWIDGVGTGNFWSYDIHGTESMSARPYSEVFRYRRGATRRPGLRFRVRAVPRLLARCSWDKSLVRQGREFCSWPTSDSVRLVLDVYQT